MAQRISMQEYEFQAKEFTQQQVADLNHFIRLHPEELAKTKYAKQIFVFAQVNRKMILALLIVIAIVLVYRKISNHSSASNMHEHVYLMHTLRVEQGDSGAIVLHKMYANWKNKQMQYDLSSDVRRYWQEKISGLNRHGGTITSEMLMMALDLYVAALQQSRDVVRNESVVIMNTMLDWIQTNATAGIEAMQQVVRLNVAKYPVKHIIDEWMNVLDWEQVVSFTDASGLSIAYHIASVEAMNVLLRHHHQLHLQQSELSPFGHNIISLARVKNKRQFASRLQATIVLQKLYGVTQYDFQQILQHIVHQESMTLDFVNQLLTFAEREKYIPQFYDISQSSEDVRSNWTYNKNIMYSMNLSKFPLSFPSFEVLRVMVYSKKPFTMYLARNSLPCISNAQCNTNSKQFHAKVSGGAHESILLMEWEQLSRNDTVYFAIRQFDTNKDSNSRTADNDIQARLFVKKTN